MNYRWCIVTYPSKSPTAKYALSLAEQGIGYVLLNKARISSDNIILAFKKPHYQPLRPGVVEATDVQVAKLEGIL